MYKSPRDDGWVNSDHDPESILSLLSPVKLPQLSLDLPSGVPRSLLHSTRE